jgi:hypothetical protein
MVCDVPSLWVTNTEALMHNTSHTWPKIWIITWILILHQSTQIMKCSKFKHSGSVTKDCTRCYKGPHRALRCEVPNSCLELGSLAGIPLLRWVATMPHKLATAPAVLKHFCNPKRSTRKAWATKAQQDWPVNVAINSWLIVCKASWESFILLPNTHYEWVLNFKF